MGVSTVGVAPSWACPPNVTEMELLQLTIQWVSVNEVAVFSKIDFTQKYNQNEMMLRNSQVCCLEETGTFYIKTYLFSEKDDTVSRWKYSRSIYVVVLIATVF